MTDLFVLLFGIAIAVVVFFVLVTIFKWLWNITMPEIFNLTAVTFWQAFRILLLASILFGGHRVVGFTPGSDAGIPPAADSAAQ